MVCLIPDSKVLQLKVKWQCQQFVPCPWPMGQTMTLTTHPSFLSSLRRVWAREVPSLIHPRGFHSESEYHFVQASSFLYKQPMGEEGLFSHRLKTPEAFHSHSVQQNFAQAYTIIFCKINAVVVFHPMRGLGCIP